MSKVGFGAYRVSIKSEEHEKALTDAIEAGVTLIDTSANYTDGDSEKLIGKVIKETGKRPFLVSKVGYIQGKNIDILQELHDQNLAKDDVVNLSADLKHSIHPDFIEDQLKRTLDRLGVDHIDAYLLHNPEYYLKENGSTKDEYYRRIALAFNKLEELVQKGLIHHYGISSNTFIDPRADHETTDLDTVYNIAKKLKDDHHFKYIQFPLNILEMGALERQYEGSHLIERANEYGLKTMINRPFNSFSQHGLLRLARYEVPSDYYQEGFADEIFNKSIQSLVIKWLEVREDEGDKLFDIPFMKQIQDVWYKQNSKDAVDQIFWGHFFPFIANVWGKDLTPNESAPFYELYEHAVLFAKKNMDERAKQFEEQALNSGLLFESDIPLSQKVIEKYQTFGVDYILVGMKHPDYVEDLKKYF